MDHALGARAAHHLLLSHGWTIPVIRRNSQGAEVGITLDISWRTPASNSRADLDLVRREDGRWFRWFADPLFGRGYPSDVTADLAEMGALRNGMDFVQAGDLDVIATPMDFIGMNYYSRTVFRANGADNDPQIVFSQPRVPEHWTEMGWEIYPDGLTNILGRVYFNYQPRKIYVTENGASYSTPPDETGKVPDVLRTSYLRTHFVALNRAIQMGVPLAGYFLWSLLDNFEWSHGYNQRFGIIWVDFDTQKRTLKDSAKWYKNVIKKNGF
jgi:beta-glucosidase